MIPAELDRNILRFNQKSTILSSLGGITHGKHYERNTEFEYKHHLPSTVIAPSWRRTWASLQNYRTSPTPSSTRVVAAARIEANCNSIRRICMFMHHVVMAPYEILPVYFRKMKVVRVSYDSITQRVVAGEEERRAQWKFDRFLVE